MNGAHATNGHLLGVLYLSMALVVDAQRDIITAGMNSSEVEKIYDPAADYVSSPGSPDNSKSDLQLVMLLMFFVLILAFVAVCSLYSVCANSDAKCCLFNRLDPQSFEAMMTRSPSYFREDLLNEDEILRLWICFYCDFANYEMKAHCALCGNDKCEKEMPQTPRRKAQSVRPASLFASMATTVTSSSRSLSPSFLLRGSASSPSSPRTRAASAPVPSNQRSRTQSLTIETTESSRSVSDIEFTSVTVAPSPRSPSGSTFAMLKRRREWQSVMSPTNGAVVWRHESTAVENSSAPCEEPGELPIELVLKTAFVTHNSITARHPHGMLTFVPAEGASVYGSSRPEYYNADSSYLFLDPYAIDSLRNLSFPEKHRWFMQETSSILHVRWGNPTIDNGNETIHAGSLSNTTNTNLNDNNGMGGLTLVVPRDNLFHGSTRALISASQKQLHRPLRVKFVNEPGIDAGGIVREWFGLLLAEFLDEKSGLFQPVHTNDGTGGLAYTIHPSASICVADHLLYYRAFGRLLGKALLEGHLIPVPLADFLLKHILSVPLSFADLQALDGGLAKSMLLLWKTPLIDDDDDDDDPYALDFSVYHTTMGVVDLKPNGRNITVTEANKHEYIQLYTKWHLGESAAEEIAALVSGVYDVMPVHLLAPFDYQELKLMLCGSPSIDVSDWQKHTIVVGKTTSRSNRVVAWFWKIIKGLPMEQRCRLLQFATGAAQVPVQGFKALTSSDGKLCPFTLYCVPKDECAYVRAYTCFNRLDLPICKSEKELEAAIQLVLQMDITGFSIQ